MVSSRPTSKPEAQNPPTVDPPARGTPWRQWLEPIVVVTFLSALLVILASAGSAGFQVLRSDISDLRSDIIASETRQREDIKDLKADVKEDIADLKAGNEDFKVSIKENIADLKADNESFKASIKEDIADIKASIKEDIADLKAGNESFKASIKEDIADLKAAMKASRPASRRYCRSEGRQ